MRNLEREIGTVCRKIARQVAESSQRQAGRGPSISEPRVRELLGRPRVHLRDASAAPAARAWPPGWPGRRSAATCSSSRPRRTPGEGKLTITGQLGDVMRESAQAALSYVRGHLARARARRSTDDWFAEHDIHVHVPGRARPRRTARAPASRWPPRSCRCISGRRVRDDVAMTGEITLTGQVLPIGGLKEKALAAQRNGIAHRHRARRSTRRDVEDIPEHLRNDLEFVFVEEIGEVLAVALEAATASANGRRRSRAAAKTRV